MIEFVEPPKNGLEKRLEKWETIVGELRSHRGEWAFVGNYSPGVPAQIRNGLYPAFVNEDDLRPLDLQMRQDWEVTTRKTSEGRLDMYIRYIGGN